MSANDIGPSYAKALVWCALFYGLVSGVAGIVELIIVDFIHINPHRMREATLMTMALSTPMIFLIVFLGIFIIFGLPQILQAKTVRAIMVRFGDQYENSIIMILPITAVVTWYCYEYLAPTNCNFGFTLASDTVSV